MATLLYVLLFAAGVAADMLTKHFAAAKLFGNKTVEFIPKFMSFIYVENNGAAFSSFQGMGWLLIALTVIALILIVYILYNKIIEDTFGKLSIVLIATGAVGNLIDRVFRGYVIDMIKLEFVNFAIFNIADIFVTVGTVMLLIYVLFFQKPKADVKNGETAAVETDLLHEQVEQENIQQNGGQTDEKSDSGAADENDTENKNADNQPGGEQEK